MSDTSESDFHNDLEGLSAREAFAAHGPSSYLINRLARYGLLGWALFIGLLVCNIVLGTMFYFLPPKMITLDKEGRVVGKVQLLDDTTRSAADVLGAGKRFTEAFLSHNSATVLEDKYLALAMMDKPLREKWRQIWYDLDVVNTIQQQKVHCVVLIDEEKSSFKQNINSTYFMSSVGNIRCGSHNASPIPFTLDFSMQPTRVSWTQTAGVKVVNLFTNPFEEANHAPSDG